ncbi:MAG: hypothetical protein AB7E96_04630 [Deferribacterales bacterium]
MLRILIISMMLLPAFAQADGIFKKTDPKVMKQIQYRKVMALEQMKILEKYVQCLNRADDTVTMNKCTAAKDKEMNTLWKDAGEIKQEVGEKTRS